MQAISRLPIAAGKSSLCRWAILLCLIFAMSGALHAGCAHAAQGADFGALLTAADAVERGAPCEEGAAHGIELDCTFATGCASFVTAQDDAAAVPTHGQAIDRATAETFHGTAALPQAPPPKLAHQA